LAGARVALTKQCYIHWNTKHRLARRYYEPSAVLIDILPLAEVQRGFGRGPKLLDEIDGYPGSAETRPQGDRRNMPTVMTSLFTIWNPGGRD
jgi:hypothetical protein